MRPISNQKTKTNFKILKLIFWFEMKKRISKNIFDFSNLIIELKNEKRKKNFLNLFWFKTDFKKQKSKFLSSFLIWNQKMNFKNSFIFQFLFWNWEMKNKKFSKFVLFLNQKTNYSFCTRISSFFAFHFNEEIEKRIT